MEAFVEKAMELLVVSKMWDGIGDLRLGKNSNDGWAWNINGDKKICC